MSTDLCETPTLAKGELQLATFYVGDLLLGLQIDQVQEINRRLDVTSVPHSPECVRGVINLRGEVVTAIDLRTVLGMPASQLSQESRNLIVHLGDELVGLCVDRIADIITLNSDLIEPPSPNISDVEGKFFLGVYTEESEIVAVLNIHEVLEINNQN